MGCNRFISLLFYVYIYIYIYINEYICFIHCRSMEKKWCWSCRIYWWNMDKSKRSWKLLLQMYLTKINVILQNVKQPVSVPRLNPPWTVSRWKSVHNITPRRNSTFGFFTSPTILHNLFHPGKNTASLVVPSECLNFTR